MTATALDDGSSSLGDRFERLRCIHAPQAVFITQVPTRHMSCMICILRIGRRAEKEKQDMHQPMQQAAHTRTHHTSASTYLTPAGAAHQEQQAGLSAARSGAPPAAAPHGRSGRAAKTYPGTRPLRSARTKDALRTEM